MRSGRVRASLVLERFGFGSKRLTIEAKAVVTARISLAVIALVVTCGVAVAAGLADPAQKKGGTLRIGRPRDIDSVDPAIAYNPDSWMNEFATCAKLYNYPDQRGARGAIVMPEVATGFPRVSRDGKTETINLRRTYRFNTGARVTAANFVAAFNRDANPKLKSPGTTYLHEIVGADAVISGQAQTISGVRALDPYTLQFRTTRPVADLVSRLTTPFFCPIAVNTPLQEINDPLGSGPYYVASRVPDRQVVLKRNPFYKGPRPAHVDQIVWTITGREACRVAVEQNELDFCAGAGIPSGDYAEVAAKYGINKKNGQFFFNPTLETAYFAFNHDRPAFKGVGQIPLKQAINWAIDRHALVQATGYLGGKETDQILPPTIGRNASIYPLGGVTSRSLARARALLAQAKFKPKRLVLYSRNFDPEPALARIFQFNLKRLGIDVQIAYYPSDAFNEKLGTRGEPFDVALTGWIVDYADPYAFFFSLTGTSIRRTGNVNWAYFNRPRYNRAIAGIDRLRGKARRKAYAELDADMMRKDPPWAPYTSGVRRDLVSPSFGCYVFNPVYGVDLAAACKK
jgi:ABC-type transport system substrate-binding protein